MSLPPGFSDAEEYFEACLSFFQRYSHLYWRRNTDVLTENLDFHMQLYDTDFQDCYESKAWSNTFLKELGRLTPRYDNYTSMIREEITVDSPMTLKKAHEVILLTKEIKNVCQTVNCQTVVDLGAGKGYIDNHIYVKTGFNVLGLEGQEEIYVNAKAHQIKFHPESVDNVKYIRHVVSADSDRNITNYLKDKFPNEGKGFCLVGLHACGDLTVSAINLFLKMSDARALMVTPCCYHKMERGEDIICRFKSFPLSQTLRKVYEKFGAHTFIDIPFLRMAAQPSHMPLENTQDRVFYLLARALIEVYAKKYNCVVKKRRRRTVCLESINNNFSKYAEEAVTKVFKLEPAAGADMNEGNDDISFDLTELQSMWNQIPHSTFVNAAQYISYQNHLPPVCENFILYDRLIYLNEHGIDNCYYKKVLSEKISPKYLSLFASKGPITGL